MSELRVFLFVLCLRLGWGIWYLAADIVLFGALLMAAQAGFGHASDRTLVEYDLVGDEPLPKRQYHQLIFFAIGVIGICVMLGQTDFRQVDWSETVLRLMPRWLSLALIIWTLIYVLHTLAYLIIIGEPAKKIGFFKLFKITISGFAINNVTPIGLMGGEPYKIMELRQYVGGTMATANTLIFSVIYVMSQLFEWGAGAAAYMFCGLPGGTMATVIAAIVLALCAVGLVAFAFSRGRGVLMPIMRFLCRLPFVGKYAEKILDKNRESIEMIDREIPKFHARTSEFWITIALVFATRLLEALEYYVFFRVLNAGVSYGYSLIVLATASLIGNLFFIIPMQLSAREGGFALPLSWIGVSASISITASLMSRIREIVYLALGTLVIVIKNRSVRKK